jgi:rieske iron-sulfur protein
LSDSDNDTKCEAQCACQQRMVDRRSVLRGVAATAGLAGLGAINSAFAQGAADSMPPQPGDFLVSENGTTPLTPDKIRLNSAPYNAWAMAPDGTVRKSEFTNQLQLLRYDPTTLPADVQARAGEGVVGFTVICTHAGCPLSGQLDGGLIACDCHGSRFDPLKNGAVAHGPAVRKLPQLSLTVTDGKLVVAEAFDSKVGGDMSGEDDR